MEISGEELSVVHQKIKEYRPMVEISRWLMDDCHLSFKDAARVRMDALKQIGVDLCTYAHHSQANLNVLHAQQEIEKKQQTQIKRQATLMHKRQLALDQIQNEHGVVNSSASLRQQNWCITCHDETFSCACEVKRVEDIPF